nr:L,D-transpeptidase family protein [Nitratireductor sp.]
IAMEQLRWHPRDLGSRHVFINQPAFRARYVEGGVTRLDMRVVVGTKANQTYFFHDMVETVEYNPYWGVPKSILVNEFLPKLRQNPAYLDERGYEVTDGRGNRIASASIDWWSVGSNVPFDVRQSPGEANALGELKILFPNSHAIYMHDTPARDLFNKDFRAYSHGCVRLAEPRAMAAAVLGKPVSHVEDMLSRGHGQDEVPVKFPVYVAYFTAWPTDEGKVEYFADIYGRDQAVMKAFAAIRAERGAAG